MNYFSSLIWVDFLSTFVIRKPWKLDTLDEEQCTQCYQINIVKFSIIIFLAKMIQKEIQYTQITESEIQYKTCLRVKPR